MSQINFYIENLSSGDRTVIIETLHKLRTEGATPIVPIVIKLLAENEDEEIRKQLVAFLNDLKDNSAIPAIMEAIDNEKYHHIREVLVSSCWQSGLNYGKYLADFVNLILTSDYPTAVEAFTVIEENISHLNSDEAKTMALRASQVIENADSEMKPLLKELVKLLTEK
jgi:hypothetical protein